MVILAHVLVAGDAGIGDDLEVAEAGAVVEFEKGKRLGVPAGADPAGDYAGRRRVRSRAENVLDQDAHGLALAGARRLVKAAQHEGHGRERRVEERIAKAPHHRPRGARWESRHMANGVRRSLKLIRVLATPGRAGFCGCRRRVADCRCVCTGTSRRSFFRRPRISPVAGRCPCGSHRKTADGRIARMNTTNTHPPRLPAPAASYRK